MTSDSRPGTSKADPAVRTVRPRRGKTARALLWASLVSACSLLTVSGCEQAVPPPVTTPAPDREPRFSGTQENLTYKIGSDIGSVVLPGATGGDGRLSYRVTGLPPGLGFDTATRILSGTLDTPLDRYPKG